MAPQHDTEAAQEVHARGQQSMLARQRAQEQGDAQQGRFSKWFPLGAKAGFDQVCSANSKEAHTQY